MLADPNLALEIVRRVLRHTSTVRMRLEREVRVRVRRGKLLGSKFGVIVKWNHALCPPHKRTYTLRCTLFLAM